MKNWIKRELRLIDSLLIPKWLLFLLYAMVTVLFIVAVPLFLELVKFLGQRIPQKNIPLDYIKGLIWAGLLGLSIFFWPIQVNDKKALLWIWLIKCFVMLGFMLFYEYHYQIDSFGYFSGARFDISLWKSMDLGGTNFYPVFITWLHQHTLLDSYHAVKVTFGMIGLMAVYIFYRSMVVFLKQENIRLLYVFAFFPSILFWSSTLGKDPLVLFGICVYCYGMVRWVRESSWQSAIIWLMGIIIATIIRPWMGFILGIPAFIVTIIIFNRKPRVIKIAAMLIVISIGLFFTKQVFTQFEVKSAEDLISVANQKFIGFARGGSMTAESRILAADNSSVIVSVSGVQEVKFSNKKQMLFFIPQGMFTALFRPMPGEVKNVFGFLAGLEGAFMLILFILAIKRIRWKELLDPIMIWAISLILIWAGVYSFVSYNLGTICRYRVQILPIFLGLLLYQTRSRSAGRDLRSK